MKLTDEKIAELAPGWATHYDATKKYKSILFENEHLYTIVEWDGGTTTPVWSKRLCGLSESSKPIPRKPNRFGFLELKKKVAIALAKHFGLTGEDLK